MWAIGDGRIPHSAAGKVARRVEQDHARDVAGFAVVRGEKRRDLDGLAALESREKVQLVDRCRLFDEKSVQTKI